MSDDFLDYVREMIREWHHVQKEIRKENSHNITFEQFLLMRKAWNG